MKFCGSCKKTLKNEFFEKRGEKGLQSWCIKCKREYDRNYAKTNEKRKKALKESKEKVYKRNRSYVLSCKQKPCLDCGIEYPPEVMDFHHLKNKKKNIGQLVFGSIDLLKKEIEKCVVLCSNCHRMRTYKNKRIPLEVP